MTDEILSIIYSFSKNFIDPKTNLSFEPKNKNISVIIKEGNVNIFLQVKDNETAIYKDILNQLKEKIEQIPKIISVNIALTSEKKQN